MPVQTRQATQAASQLYHPQYSVNVSASVLAPQLLQVTPGWLYSGTGMHLVPSQMLATTTASTPPVSHSSTGRRVCSATPMEESIEGKLHAILDDASDRLYMLIGDEEDRIRAVIRDLVLA